MGPPRGQLEPQRGLFGPPKGKLGPEGGELDVKEITYGNAICWVRDKRKLNFTEVFIKVSI